MIIPSPTCYPCLGTGRVVGFSAHGQQCPCVTCSESGCRNRATVVIDEETGEKLCGECVAFRAEEAAMDEPLRCTDCQTLIPPTIEPKCIGCFLAGDVA